VIFAVFQQGDNDGNPDTAGDSNSSRPRVWKELHGGDIDIDTTVGGQGDTAVPTMPPIAQPSAPMTLPPLFPESILPG